MSGDQANTDLANETNGNANPPDQSSEVGGESSEQPPWQLLVEPYITTLAAKILEQHPQGHSISIPIGRFDILVSPLDQNVALRTSRNQDLDCPHHQLIRDAIGMDILIAVAQRKYEKAKNAKQPGASDRIEKGLSLGYQLAHLMTVEMRQMRNDGQLDAASEVQDARRRLTSIINEAEETVDRPAPPPKINQDSETHDQEPQRFVYQWESSSGADSGDNRPAVEVSKIRSVPISGSRGSKRQRLILGLLVLVFAAVLTNLWLNRAHQLQDFSIEDFPEVPGIEQVINRSPVILIVVSEEKWKQIDRYNKELAVTSVGKTVEPAGYKKAEFRSTLSVNLASWNGGNNIFVRD